MILLDLLSLRPARAAGQAEPQVAQQQAVEVEPRAVEVERHLLAPCCYRETLDVHESELATSLRREIRRRLGEGESPAAIEARLVERYGAKIRATLPGNLGPALLVSALCGGALLLGLRRRKAAPPQDLPQPRDPPKVPDRERRDLEDRLDEDLAAL